MPLRGKKNYHSKGWDGPWGKIQVSDDEKNKASEGESPRSGRDLWGFCFVFVFLETGSCPVALVGLVLPMQPKLDYSNSRQSSCLSLLRNLFFKGSLSGSVEELIPLKEQSS